MINGIIRTDRGFDYNLRPILKNSNIPAEAHDRSYFTSQWTEKHHMILDVISDIIYNSFHKETKPTNFSKIPKDALRNKNIKNLNFYNNFYNPENNTETVPEVKIPDYEIFHNYKHLRKYNSTELYKLIKEVSEKIFHLSNYGIRCFDPPNKKNKKITYYNNFFKNKKEGENIFDVEIVESTGDKFIKNRFYKFSFNSLIGRGFYQNMILLNTDLIDIEYEDGSYYKMRGLAPFFYRRFVACRKIGVVQSFSIVDMAKYFVCNKNNISLFKKSINGILNKLEKQKLIDNHSMTGIGLYTFIEFTRKH